MSDPKNTILTVDELSGGYGPIPVLHGVSFEVNEGEILGVLGHNGMGKTTLLKTLMGFLPATGGRVIYDGEDISALPVHRRSMAGMGYVPQGRGIFAQLSVRDNLLFAWPGDVCGTQSQALDRSLEWFPRLKRLLNRQGGNLSGGEQQLLALARCLMPDPILVLLDEPTEGIQPSIIDEMIDTLARIRQQSQLSVLLVEQNLDFLCGLSDRLIVLERGEVVDELDQQAMSEPSRLSAFSGLGDSSVGALATPVSKPQAVPFTEPFHPLSLPDKPPAIPTLLSETHMSIRRPSLEQMRELTAGLGMSMGDRELLDYLTMMEGSFGAYDVVDSMPDNIPEVRYPRTPGRRPEGEENKLNAWYVKTEVKGAGGGPLAGRRIVLKDNVALAGVPMMNGASTLEGYVPDLDATVVSRILDAGGTIVGKAHCEYFCLSGGSHTNATGPVHNPHRHGYIAGGSSSGSGALVGAGEVEMAIGGDQGGSIRIPASFCGCYGMKPTHGLVPYSGIMPIENTIDHVGPITGTVRDNALLLEVIAGEDGLDPRQYAPVLAKYTQDLGRGVSGLRIGIVKEGFELPNMERGVDSLVRQAAAKLREGGARVDEISVPMHTQGAAIWTPIALEGLTNQMMHGNGMGTGWEGLYMTSLLDYHAGWRSRADELSASLKVSMFVGEYMQKYYRGHYHAKAQNLRRRLRAAYDVKMEEYDLLLMPTLPITAQPIPPADAPIALTIERAFEMVANTCPFDATGHPAMSVPVGMSGGLPVGMMLVGKHYDESTIYRAASAFESLGDWREFRA